MSEIKTVQVSVEKVERREPPEPEGWTLFVFDDGSWRGPDCDLPNCKECEERNALLAKLSIAAPFAGEEEG